MDDKYHAIAPNYPTVTPEEGLRMFEILKYGLSQYKELYVEKQNWGEKAADEEWRKKNSIVAGKEGQRRGLMKRADGYPTGSHEQRHWLKASLNIQENMPKLVLQLGL
jgi:hypothetical protein